MHHKQSADAKVYKHFAKLPSDCKCHFFKAACFFNYKHLVPLAKEQNTTSLADQKCHYS